MRLREIKLLEGGNALPGVGRVERKFIPHVIEYVSHLSGIPKADLHPLGSTGKNSDSGDIDVGIDSGKYMPDQIHARLSTRLGPDKHYYNNGTKIHSYAVPIVKKVGQEFVEVGGTVQVDFIFTPRLDWAKFAYHSEGTSGEQTSYKGAVRTILLKAVAASYEEKGIDMSVYDPQSGELIIRVGRTFDLSNGLRRIFQVRTERKTTSKKGNPIKFSTEKPTYVGSLQTVHTIEELQPALDALKKRYPGQFDDVRLDVKDHEIIIDDPVKALKMIFPGSPVQPKQVATAEGVLDLIQQRFTGEEQVKIFKKAKEAIQDLGGSMRVPDIDAFIEHARKNVK
jgi:hypothetical protein